MNVEAIIDELTAAFADKDKRYVNLGNLREYMAKDKSAGEAKIFKQKLDNLRGENLMKKEDFKKYFMPNLQQYDEFKMVFQTIDTDKSEKISKKELQILNKEKNLGLTDSDIDIMINFVSKDMQTVHMKDLHDFLNK